MNTDSPDPILHSAPRGALVDRGPAPLTPQAARSIAQHAIARGWIARPGEPDPRRLRRPYEARRDASYLGHDRRTARMVARLEREGAP